MNKDCVMKYIHAVVLMLLFVSSCVKEQSQFVDDTDNKRNMIDSTNEPVGEMPVHIETAKVLSVEPWPYDESLHKVVNKYLPTMVFVPATTFRLGTDTPDDHTETDASPSSQVSLRQFFMSETPVTIDLWNIFLDETGYTGFTGIHSYDGPLEDNVVGGQSPIMYMTWDEAVYFCNWLSDVCGLERAYELSGALDATKRGGIEATWIRDRNGFRLITEAEWELVNYEGGKDIDWLREHYKEPLSRPPSKKRPFVQEGSLSSFGIRVYPNFGFSELTWDEDAPFTAEPKVDPTGPSGLQSNENRKVRRFFTNNSFFNRISTSTEGGEGSFITFRLAQDKR